MATNRGVAPPDLGTDVGQLRMNIGDTTFTPLPEGEGDYANFSDEFLEAQLLLAGGSITRATAYAYARLAAEYAASGKSVRTDDLNLDTRNRGGNLLDVAKWWSAEADAEDVAAAGDFFQIIPHAGRPGRRCVRPEATPATCRCGGDC